VSTKGFVALASRVAPNRKEARVSQQALQARIEAVSDARRYVRDRLDGVLTPDRLSEVELLTSELFTNAVRHAGLEEGDRIHLDIDVDTDTVHVAVVDAGPGFDSSKIFHEPRDPGGGWGLFLVHKVSDRWGIDPSPPHSVWFEIDH
jgi:anti-sigma regulatory factor (Ser/Thr protein kinase)